MPVFSEERFRSHAVKVGDCHLWAASKTKAGYGFTSRGGRTMMAHRLSWELCFGPIPDGLQVCHTCDNPSCINPEHLWLGTAAQNIADRGAKGRTALGDKMPHAKLDAEKVRYIRTELATGRSKMSLSRELGVRPYVIFLVARREKWAHVQ